MISSNKGKALSIISTWPKVTGSNDPGNTALFINKYMFNHFRSGRKLFLFPKNQPGFMFSRKFKIQF
jgi:hypothetical protein